MIYIVYKHCDEKSFYQLKKELEQIKKIILKSSDRFRSRFRHDDSDFLILNFNIADTNGCDGTFGIAFEDLPDEKTFRVAFTKSIDVNQFRFGIMKNLRERVTLENIKRDLFVIINECFKEYDGITKTDLLKNEGIVLGGSTY